MSDLYKPLETDGTDAMVRNVCHTLFNVYEEADHVARGHCHEFAFNVLLNSLDSLLDVLRSEAPDAFGTYQQMVQLVAQD